MRGWDAKSEALFSYVSCEARVPKDHPLRPIRRIVDEALAALSPEFEQLYAKFGRPSIPPERLLRALLLQAFYSVRSELQLPAINPVFILRAGSRLADVVLPQLHTVVELVLPKEFALLGSIGRARATSTHPN